MPVDTDTRLQLSPSRAEKTYVPRHLAEDTTAHLTPVAPPPAWPLVGEGRTEVIAPQRVTVAPMPLPARAPGAALAADPVPDPEPTRLDLGRRPSVLRQFVVNAGRWARL